MLLGTGILGVIAVIVIAVMLSGAFTTRNPQQAVATSTPEPVVPDYVLALRRMSPDIELLVHIKPAQLSETPLFKSLCAREEAVPVLDLLQKYARLAPKDVSNLTVGFASPQHLLRTIFGQQMGIPVLGMPEHSQAVVRLTQPTSSDHLKSTGLFQEATHQGQTFFVHKDLPDLTIWFADSTTVIIAPQDVMREAIGRGSTTTPRSQLTLIDDQRNVVVAFSYRDAQRTHETFSQASVGNLSPEMQQVQNAMANSFESFGLGLNVTQGVDSKAVWKFNNSETAGVVKRGFEKLVEEARTGLEHLKSGGPPNLVELGTSVLGNIKLEQHDQVLAVSTNVSESASSKLVSLPADLIQLALTRPSVSSPAVSSVATPNSSPPDQGLIATPEKPEPAADQDAVPGTATDLPAGISLTAHFEPSFMELRGTMGEPLLDAAGEPVHPIQFVVDLQGEGLKNVCAISSMGTSPFSTKWAN